MRHWVVLPAYDEAPRLPALLGRWREVLDVLAEPATVVVVDDGSRDGTGALLAAEAARDPRLVVLTHERNLGLGRTLHDGLRYAIERGAPGDRVVVMDGDNTHPPELYPVMLARQDALDADVVIASRYRAGAQVHDLEAYRAVLSLGARLLFQALCPIPGVRDYTCGYRLYRHEILARAQARYGEALIDRDGFESMADLLLKLHAVGARCAEVPLTLEYGHKRGASRMNVGRTTRRALALLLEHRLGRRP
ncbi:MAG: glycosyltransferase family 2 protein [Planctomycetota bacterium]